MKTNSPTILIVDDHPMVRSGLKELLEKADMKVVGEVDRGDKVLAKIEVIKPDVVLLDISLPEMSGVDIALAIQKKKIKSRIIVLTMHEDEMFLGKMVESGVNGYLLKDSPGEEIIKAIQRVMEGERYFSQNALALIGKYSTQRKERELDEDLISSLTAREKEVLQRIAQGLTSAEIAKQLFLSPRTVDTHRANIMHKLRIHNATALVRFAYDKGLVDK